MLIDSHHHLWKYSTDQYGWISDEMEVLRRDFGVQELREVARDHDVDGFVSVQARQSLQETEDLLAIAHLEPRIRGVVGWVPLCKADVGDVLDRYADNLWFKGARHVVQDESDDRFLLRDDFNRGVDELLGRGLVYDVLVFAKQLSAVVEFVDRHPDQTMVIDHIAKPTIQGNAIDADWKKHIAQLASRKHLTCKFSGVATEIRDPQWSIETVRPYWDFVLECFTPARLMFGSDWPVCLLRSEYGRWLRTVRELADPLTEDEKASLFANTAINVYNLTC